MTLMLRFGAVALLVAASHSAQAGPSIVVDATSGRIIHAEDATAPWFPASITKLMTAYVALREVKAGRINFETPLVVSKRAASAAPSKIGFKPGSEVTLENALKIIMVKSANDVSITIAEGVGGSVDAFSAMMNREAARLGMRESNFVNPNGLPDARNSTSARDMAVLARAMLTEMPEYEELWGIGAIRLGKRVMQNTNGLIGRYPGADGMKTGFICSSGFNVVASASRNGQSRPLICLIKAFLIPAGAVVRHCLTCRVAQAVRPTCALKSVAKTAYLLKMRAIPSVQLLLRPLFMIQIHH
jgi:D-alanyl-D-alanine carboxypeptidase